LKYDQLTPERSILSLKPTDRPERRNQQPQKEKEKRDHRDRRYAIPLPDQTDEVFGTHSNKLKLQRGAAAKTEDEDRNNDGEKSSTCRDGTAGLQKSPVFLSLVDFEQGQVPWP